MSGSGSGDSVVDRVDESDPFFVAGGGGGTCGRISSRESAPLAAPRILLISYHFPPGQAVGGLRWQQFARFARERGWGVDAVTLDPEDLGTPDRERLDKLPDGTRVWGVPEAELPVDRVEEAAGRLYRGVLDALSGDGDGPGETLEVQDESVNAEDLRWLPRSPRDLYRAFNAWLHPAPECHPVPARGASPWAVIGSSACTARRPWDGHG